MINHKQNTIYTLVKQKKKRTNMAYRPVRQLYWHLIFQTRRDIKTIKKNTLTFAVNTQDN